MAKPTPNQKFTQTNPHTRISWHTCKYTGQLFCSTKRRETYSPEGLRLKNEQAAAIKSARLEVCPVYFYYCPISLRWFTTRTPSSTTPESKEAARLAMVEIARRHRQRPEVRERERLRTRARKDYRREWTRQNSAKLREQRQANP